MMNIDWRDRISIMGAVLVSFIVTSGFIAVCAALFFFEIPESSRRIADNLFGGLLVAFAGVVQYWTGSTSSSQKKDAVMADQVSTASAAIVDTAKTAAVAAVDTAKAAAAAAVDAAKPANT